MVPDTALKIIQEDIAILNSHPKLGGTVGQLLGHGTYGFVCRWEDGTPEAKVVKVIDPAYIACRSSAMASQIEKLLTASYIRQYSDDACIHYEAYTSSELLAAQTVGSTKNRHLMPILKGSQYLRLKDRDVDLIVMPQLTTIEELPLSNSPMDQIVDILCQCCEGLHVLHREPQVLGGYPIGPDSLIHNDLKPDNIFLTRTVSDGQSGNCYIVGDYSACLTTANLKPGMEYPKLYQMNPYYAPGPIGVTSDIWSLGWIFWYWMNGKVHPTQADIESRKNKETTRKPKNWGTNPELWEVFLKMTDFDPAQRYQDVDTLHAALRKAQSRRSQRILQEEKDETGLAVTMAFAAILTIYNGIKKIWSNETKDSSGLLHGKSRKVHPFLNGTFQGEWNHGFPCKGEFVYNGRKRSGSWEVKKDYKVPFSHFGYMVFSGLICTDGGEEDFYHGVVSIHWNTGTKFEAEVRTGAYHNGILTYRDGRVRTGSWETVNNSQFCGVFCGEDHDFYGCGIRTFPGDAAYEGEYWHGQPVSGELIFPNRKVSSANQPAFENAWGMLMDMQNFRGSYSGGWSEEGYPQQGTYTFSTGSKVTGRFTYSRDEEYTGMVLNGKACGIGCHPLGKYMVRTGEFLDGQCTGYASVKHQCGAYFAGLWSKDQIRDGVVVFTDGTEKYGKDWSLTNTKLRSGNSISGIFTNSRKHIYGLGEVYFPSENSIFAGEVMDDYCKSGTKYDSEGNEL